MVVKIEEIRDEGLELDESISIELLETAIASDREPGYRVLKPSQLKCHFRKVSGGVLLNGEFTADLQAPCKRCLSDVELLVPVAFMLNLVPAPKLEREKDDGEDDEVAKDAGSFDLKNADQEVFDGKTIDLDPIVREQVLLALPLYVVCDEECKGLCPMCGQDLNDKQCGCEPKVTDPRLAVLKNIKLN